MTREQPRPAPRSKQPTSRLRPDTRPRATPTTFHRVAAIFDGLAKVIGLGFTGISISQGYLPSIGMAVLLLTAAFLTVRSFRYTRGWLLARLIVGVLLVGSWAFLLWWWFQPAFLAHIVIDFVMVIVCVLGLYHVKRFEARNPLPVEDVF